MKLINNKCKIARLPVPPTKKEYTWIAGSKVISTPSIWATQIRYAYKHWKNMYLNGGSDPFWCDGVNLNLVRGHIQYYRGKIEELLGDAFHLYPDEYFWCDLPELDNNYMGKARRLLSMPNYKEAQVAASEREYTITF